MFFVYTAVCARFLLYILIRIIRLTRVPCLSSIGLGRRVESCGLWEQPPHKVDLTNAEKTILVQLLKSNAALSVVSNYKQLSKFNVRELSTSDEEQQKAVKAAAAAKKEAADAAAAAPAPVAAAEPAAAAQEDGAQADEGTAAQHDAEKEGKEEQPAVEQDGSVDGFVGAGIAMVADDEDSDAAAP